MSCQYFFPAKDNLGIEPNHYRKLCAISNSFVKIRTLTTFTRENTLFLYIYCYIFNIRNELLAYVYQITKE